MMNVLILGSGGREHALCQKISESPLLSQLYAIPGNPGINEVALCYDIDPKNHHALKRFVLSKKIDLIIPGSEIYLVDGITDLFADTNVRVFGPTKQAAQLESSKVFAKNIMTKYHIPTADYNTFTDYDKACDYLEQLSSPYVIKYNGLAGGKGVTVTADLSEAKEILKSLLVDHQYGDESVIIETFLTGDEFSFMCFVHHDIIIPMPICQDHKPLLDNGIGPNTGGMGMVCPVDSITDQTIQKAFTEIMQPIVTAMVKEGHPFTGFLYGGLIQTESGPKVIEFNARFGDPEAEVLCLKLKSDLLSIIVNLFDGLKPNAEWHSGYHLGVVLASKGYPKKYSKNQAIHGLNQLKTPYFHMGTKNKGNTLVTAGGRVLCVVGHKQTFKETQQFTYSEIKKISCDTLMYRSDIGQKSQRGYSNE
ncbi:MAG: phosphoribosylamine--glycine ligase [Candidatus Izemoplasma sp.]|nr:phosphoribosylamine--glycine ligase [Candidatus Izemoplasma sp.]